MTLAGGAFYLFDGHCAGQNGLHTHFVHQCNEIRDGVARCEQAFSLEYSWTVADPGFPWQRSLLQNAKNANLKCILENPNWVKYLLNFSGSLFDCGDPGQVQNAQRDRRFGPFSFGTVVTYTCNQGYQGWGSIFCRANGQWSGQRPTCTGSNFEFICYKVNASMYTL